MRFLLLHPPLYSSLHTHLSTLSCAHLRGWSWPPSSYPSQAERCATSSGVGCCARGPLLSCGRSPVWGFLPDHLSPGAPGTEARRRMIHPINAHAARAPPTSDAEAPESRQGKLALGRLRQRRLHNRCVSHCRIGQSLWRDATNHQNPTSTFFQRRSFPWLL
jgi:hypothetical protein